MRETPDSKGKLATVLKWVGATTALLSLVFGLRQLTLLISDARDRQRQVTELIAVAELQQEARDYGAAWKSLGKAADVRATDSRIRTAQEDLAMAWLDDIRGDQGPAPFSATVDMLVPVMSRGAVAAEGARKADLLAHLGWADPALARRPTRARSGGSLSPGPGRRCTQSVRPCHVGALDVVEWRDSS
jgi:hypothetical protein